jgi:hypothetical protein
LRTNIATRLAKGEQCLAPQGSFVAVLTTLGTYDNAERARFEIEHDESGARTYHARPDPDGALGRAAQEAPRAHEAAMVGGLNPCRRRDGPSG